VNVVAAALDEVTPVNSDGNEDRNSDHPPGETLINSFLLGEIKVESSLYFSLFRKVDNEAVDLRWDFSEDEEN
jgi:hypothetical protein